MDTYIQTTVNPLLEGMAAILIRDKPVDPIPALIAYLHRQQPAPSIDTLLAALKQPEPAVYTSDDDEEALTSPMSTGLLSPSHSPRNVQRYWKRGARLSVSAVPTDDMLRRFGNIPEAPEKEREELSKLTELLRHSTLAVGKSDEEIQRIADGFVRETIEGTGVAVPLAPSIILIQEGQIERVCFREDCDEVTSILGPGDVVGNVNSLIHSDTCDSVVLTTVSDRVGIWRLNSEYLDFVVRSSAIRKREQYLKFLESVPILAPMDPDELGKICDALKSENFEAGQTIVSQDEDGNKFYIVESGECVATRSYVPGQVPREVMRYRTGDYFGELSLLHNEPRAANVVAVTPVTVVGIDRKSFKRLLGPIENILRRNSTSYNESSSLH